MNVYISQSTINKSVPLINEEKNRVTTIIEKLFPDERIKIINSITETSNDLYSLGKSIQLLSEADIAYFVNDWYKYRSCRAENYLAKVYNIKVIEE